MKSKLKIATWAIRDLFPHRKRSSYMYVSSDEDSDDERSEIAVSLDPSEPVKSDVKDWSWPAADTFTDGTICLFVPPTCSELGSKRIRLIRIHSGSLGGMITCDTKVCLLDQAGAYTALSYTWGSPALQRQVIINDEPRAVTTNLWRFLSQARELPARFSGWLWIDALSIDQADPWEKAEQVKVISRIFACAKKAVVWLGPAYGDSDRAMKVLATLSSSGTGWKSPRSFWAPPVGPAILALCERAYWQRLWVFQELKVSHRIDVMCGDRNIKFERLRAFLLAENVDERTREQVQTLEKSSATKMAALTLGSLDTSLESMLEATNHLRCRNPLDRAYAILNVVSTGREGIEVDYTVTTSELINTLLRRMAEQGELGDLSAVYRKCWMLEQLFAVEQYSMFKVEGGTSHRTGSHKFAGRFLLSGVKDHHIMKTAISLHTWCKRYDHKEIGRMIQRSFEERKQSEESYHIHDALHKKLRKDLMAAIGLFDSS
jgi:hypothetical protein